MSRIAELFLFAALAALHTWPLVSDPAHLSRLDNNDTAFNTWVVAWVAHQLPRQPLALFDAPIFHPENNALAFSEHLAVPAVMAMPLFWLGASPVLVYNLLVLIGHTLSGFAMSRLVGRWTGSATAGIVSGALFAFNAHLLTRFAHLQAMHVEFLPIALYAFDRLLERARWRDAWWLAAAFTLQALCSLYMMVMLGVALVVCLVMRPDAWRATNRRAWVMLFAAGASSAVVLLPFLWPYYQVKTTYGLVRTIDEVRLYSAGWNDYLATAGRLHHQVWSQPFFAKAVTALFPGITAVLLTTIAIASGVLWRDRRARMVCAFGVIGFVLSFGASLPGYPWLLAHVPLFDGIRAVARWGFLALTAVAILSGYGVAYLQTRIATPQWWPAIATATVGLVTVEALRAPIPLVRFDRIATVHARLNAPEVTGIVVFPLYGGSEYHHNAPFLLDQTRHWRPMVNGYSSFAPQTFFDRVARLQRFPAPEVLEELRSIGVSHVVLYRAPLEQNYGREAVAALRAHPDLQFVIDQEGVTIYRLK